MKRGVDTNVLLRWLVADSLVGDDAPAQKRAAERFFGEAPRPIVINHIVLAETIWVLQNRAGRKKAVAGDVVNALLKSADVEIDQHEIVEAALANFLGSSGDFADHLIGELNAEFGCIDTVTFDKAAAKSSRFTLLTES
ncbi:MAG: type II toxin-antitoxin system VapC family toxin [Pseudomonadota bacterium]